MGADQYDFDAFFGVGRLGTFSHLLLGDRVMSIWRKLHHVLSGGYETQHEKPRKDRQLRNRRITLEPLEERRLLSATHPWTACQVDQIDSNAAETIAQQLVYPAIFDGTLGAIRTGTW